jgi:Mlc titration factor MtfA (ptsG expression regulator)
LLRWFRRTPAPLDDALWQQTCRGCHWLHALQPAQQERLRALTGLFLRHKTITPVAGLVLDEGQRMLLAAMCCLPLIEFGAEGLHGWSELVVYPDAFRVRRRHSDAIDDGHEWGVVHEWDDELIGESWDSGPLILSWADVQADIADPHAGLCVAVHEMAHKLDALDGAIDGTPPLPREWQRQWAHDFQQCYDHFRAQVDREQEVTLDPYAAEAPEEFFAVVSEYHFSAPDVLEQAMPAVAAHLRRLYGPSPGSAAQAQY